MGERLGIVGDGNRGILSPEQVSASEDTDLEVVTKRTAWGLFHVDTYSIPSLFILKLGLYADDETEWFIRVSSVQH